MNDSWTEKKTLLPFHVQFMNDSDFLFPRTSDPIFRNEYHTHLSWTSNYHIQEKNKGNRPAAPNPREDIHGNLFDYEEFMNSLWTAYEQFMNNNTFCNMFAGGGVTGAASLPSADGVALPRSKQKDKCS